MKHDNRQGELQYHLRQKPAMPTYRSVCICFVDISFITGDIHYHLSQHAAMPSYMSVWICFVDISYPTYFQINLAFICFILPLQISLTVLQYFHVPGCRLLNYSARATSFSGSVEICSLGFRPAGACVQLWLGIRGDQGLGR